MPIPTISQLPEPLAQLLAAGEGTRFWSELERRGLPVIDEEVAGQCCVTFLLRARSATEKLMLYGGALLWQAREMQLIPGTDVWAYSLELPTAFRGGYYWYDRSALAAGAEQDWEQLRAQLRNDPLNPETITFLFDSAAARPPQHMSIVALPKAEPCLLPNRRPATESPLRHGRLFQERVSSKLLGNTRDVSVYLPSQFAPGATLPLLICFDGSAYAHALRVPEMLDALIEADRIPPLVTLFPCSISTETRNRELPCNPQFVSFLEEELIPWAEHAFAFQSKGESTILAGSSYGGLAALYATLLKPQRFGSVLSQAGAFYWSHDYKSAPEAFMKMVAQASALPRYMYFDAGLYDDHFTSDGLHASNLAANRQLRDLLQVRGYDDFCYHEYCGDHDYACWQAGFPRALERVLKGGSIVR